MLKLLLGDPNARKLKKYQPYISEINLLDEEIQALCDEDLKGKTAEFQQRLGKGETLDDILPEAFAVVREAGRRVLGLRHFDVQLLGGVILHSGQIAEMKTGEGKTLVATLPSYLNALTGKGVDGTGASVSGSKRGTNSVQHDSQWTQEKLWVWHHLCD